jgi:Na+/H+-dicarboxylate symporter
VVDGWPLVLHFEQIRADLMESSGSSSKRWLLGSGVLALLLALATVYLVHYYGETRPTVAQAQIGRIHAATIHSRTVYLTTGEYALAFATHILAIIAIGVFLGLVLRSIGKRRAPKIS